MTPSTDPLERAFLRLRDAADADEYVPTEQVIDTVLARLAAARAENERLRNVVGAVRLALRYYLETP